ncbi:MAG TPA: SDR family oxidoreductase [Solirubrobacteraceae bacterium]
MSDGAILLTGATGFLGMELLARLTRDCDRDVIMLIRARDDEAAGERLDAVLDTIMPPGVTPRGALRAVAADIEAPDLGLSARRRRSIASEVGTVVHCAASVSFTLPIGEARRINVDGTRAIVELAEQALRLDRLIHVSTAYVAGDRDGHCHEHEGDVGQRHRNTYEQTKLEAEQAVTDSGLPSAILRPSIVVGDSRTGWTPAFNVIYWPLQAFARGLFPVVPGDPDTPVDIVPADTVADALMTLATGPRQAGVFHVAAGANAPRAGQLAALAARAFDAPEPRFVPAGDAPEVEARAGAYLPYFRNRAVFDTTNGTALGFTPPPLDEYFDAIMGYARTARWGKRPRPRYDPSGEAIAA